MNISVIALVYNEEKRIRNLLDTLVWSDDVILIDKSSTDRTVEIAHSYGARIVSVPYSDTGGEFRHGVAVARNDWVMFVVASDMVHPELADRLLGLVNRTDFPYDVIAFPYVVGALGIMDSHSPWDFPLKKNLMRKSVIVVSDTVHKEVSPASKRVFKMKRDRAAAVYHFTHQTVDSFFERHLRYTKAEATKYTSMPKGLVVSLAQTCASIGWTGAWRRTWLLGWDGVALMVAFATYFMMKFLYVWERFRGPGEERYAECRKNILAAWQARKP